MHLLVTGIPASGKSTIARALAEKLGLEIWDKDDILEDLFNKRVSEIHSGGLCSAVLLMRFCKHEYVNPRAQ